MKLPGAITFDSRRVLLKHHRLLSGTGRHPPNSLSALRELLDGEADVIEFDVRAVSDGDYLLVHDDTLERETTGIGAVREITRAAARGLHLKGSDEPVALLSALAPILAVHRRSLKVEVDLKDQVPLSKEEARQFLGAIEPLRANSRLKVVVGCLGDWNLRTLRRLDATLAVGLDFALYLDIPVPEFPRLPLRVNVYEYLDDHPLGYMRAMPVRDYLQDRVETLCHLVPGAVEVYMRVDLVGRALADGINLVEIVRGQLGGVCVDVWTLNADNPRAHETLLMVLEAGVDQIATDTAVQLAGLFKQRPRHEMDAAGS